MSVRQSQRSSDNHTVLKLAASLVLLGIALVVFQNRQAILDQYALWQYEPSAEIASITKRSALSQKGTDLFYASRPELLERDAFNSACRSVASEQTAVLGCFADSRIYLFDIDNQKLDGIKEVTAAHEMLHAAYVRLPQAEKERVNALLEKQSQSLGPDQQRIDELMAEYAKTEPGERLNELHSILGSEVGNLRPELESYYARYFSNRSALIALAQQYQSVFADLQARQVSLAAAINELADEIDTKSATYKRNLQVLTSDIEAFNRRASSGRMTRADYDSERTSLEARQTSLRRDYDAIQALIATYETKRDELAAINTESNALNRSINSSLAPVPSGGFDG